MLALGHGFELSEQNIIAVTDRTLFGEAHLYREWLPDGGRIFFDPEGLLSTLPCIAQVIIGYFCGNILREKTEIHHRLLQISILGIALLFAGWLLSYGCPLNKKVWSPTFVLGGLCLHFPLPIVIALRLPGSTLTKKYTKLERGGKGGEKYVLADNTHAAYYHVQHIEHT